MNFLKFFQYKSKKPARKVVDFAQLAIEKNGRDQIQKIVDKGLSLPILIV